MARFLLVFIFGLCWLHISQAEIVLNITCRYRGVFHVEKNNRYSLTRDDGTEICHLLNSSLATMEQLEKAHEIGFETCRYGWIEENIVVPRIHPHPICAANNTGVYILISNITDRYDVYCFNASETRKKVCDPIILPPSFTFYPDKTVQEQGPHPIDPLGPGSGTEAPYQKEPTPSKSDTGEDQQEIDDYDLFDSLTTQDPDHSESDTDTATDGYSHIESDLLHPEKSDHDNFGEITTKPSSPSTSGDEDSLIHIIQHPVSTSIPDTTETPYGSYEETTKEDENENIAYPPQTEDHPDKTQTDTETGDSKSEHNNGNRSGGLSGGQETTDAPGARRSARVPDWLIITVSLISLALILAVCIAVNSRRRCGHKKKLVINGNKGPVEDGRMEEVNGEASKSQEMVHLVHQEHTSDTSGRLMSAEQVRNQHQGDMKIGV